jgi:ATP-dependent Clp protease protease subunit
MSKAWFTAHAAGSVGEITILSDIGEGGVVAEDIHAQLARFKAQGVRTLLITINSNGGDVTMGFAVYNMLSRWPHKKIVRVDGLAASMASVIAMVGDEIVMPSNSLMMVHNPWGSVGGSAEQIKSFGTALEMMKQNIIGAYVKRTQLTIEKVRALMDAESWLSAAEAVRLGFADRVEGELKAAALAGLPDISKFKNAPSVPRGLDAVREEAYRRFNRTKGGRRALRNS